MKPAWSMASAMPILCRSFRVLGGMLSARADCADGRVNNSTSWPQLLSRRAAVEPAGPPPITRTSKSIHVIGGLVGIGQGHGSGITNQGTTTDLSHTEATEVTEARVVGRPAPSPARC